jgi:hypothetical protein
MIEHLSIAEAESSQHSHRRIHHQQLVVSSVLRFELLFTSTFIYIYSNRRRWNTSAERMSDSRVGTI